MVNEGSGSQIQAEDILRAGVAKKRNGRMSRWSTRWFILAKGGRLVYKIKEDDSELKAAYDLMPGCLVTDIETQAKRMHSFWIVWPSDKRVIGEGDEDAEDDGTLKDSSESNAVEPTAGNADSADDTNNLRRKLEKEVTDYQQERDLVSQQLERHMSHDNAISLIPKVAGVVLGGVLVGVFTAGVGLVPYLGVVGGVVVAGGGTLAYSRYRRPADSRLIMAFHSREEAEIWKAALEAEVSKLEKKRAPTLSAITRSSRHIISTLARLLQLIYGRNSSRFLQACWVHVSTVETTRVMQLVPAALMQFALSEGQMMNQELFQAGSVVKHAFQVISSTTLETFLTVMEEGLWPERGSCTVVHAVDDHTDILFVRLYSPTGGKRSLFLTRFWRLDEDGVYVVTFTTISFGDVITLSRRDGERLHNGGDASTSEESLDVIESLEADENDDHDDDDTNLLSRLADAVCRRRSNHSLDQESTPTFGAIISISPRKDHAEFDDEVPLSLLSVIAYVADPENAKRAGTDVKGVTGASRSSGGGAGSGSSSSSSSNSSGNSNSGSSSSSSSGGGLGGGGDKVTNLKANPWKPGEAVAVLDSFLCCHVLDLKLSMEEKKFTPAGNGTGTRGAGHPSNSSSSSSSSGGGGESFSLGPRDPALGLLSYGDDQTSSQHDRHAMSRLRVASFSGDDGMEGSIVSTSGNNNNTSSAGPSPAVTRRLLHRFPRRRLRQTEAMADLDPPSSSPFFASPTAATGTEESNRPHSSSSSAPRRTSGGAYSRSRSLSVNSEAAQLRTRLAAKEYEFQRLEVVARRRNEPAAQEAMLLLQHLMQELLDLKKQYQRLTGAPYELATGATGGGGGGGGGALAGHLGRGKHSSSSFSSPSHSGGQIEGSDDGAVNHPQSGSSGNPAGTHATGSSSTGVPVHWASAALTLDMHGEGSELYGSETVLSPSSIAARTMGSSSNSSSSSGKPFSPGFIFFLGVFFSAIIANLLAYI